MAATASATAESPTCAEICAALCRYTCFFWHFLRKFLSPAPFPSNSSTRHLNLTSLRSIFSHGTLLLFCGFFPTKISDIPAIPNLSRNPSLPSTYSSIAPSLQHHNSSLQLQNF